MAGDNIEEKLACELEVADTSRAFVVFQHTINKPTPQNKRTTPSEALFVLYLDACHSNIETIIRYEAEGKRIVHAHMPESKDREQEERLAQIRNHVNLASANEARIRKEVEDELRDKIRAQVIKEASVQEKLAQRQQNAKDKGKAGAGDKVEGSLPGSESGPEAPQA